MRQMGQGNPTFWPLFVTFLQALALGIPLSNGGSIDQRRKVTYFASDRFFPARFWRLGSRWILEGSVRSTCPVLPKYPFIALGS